MSLKLHKPLISFKKFSSFILLIFLFVLSFSFFFLFSPSSFSQTTDQTPTIACTQNSDCGTDDWIGTPRCVGQDVKQYYIQYTCNNPGTQNSYCSSTVTFKVKQTCSSNQACFKGECVNILCTKNSDCGNDNWVGLTYCSGNSVFQNYITYTCSSPNTIYATCLSYVFPKLKEACGTKKCVNGICVDKSTTPTPIRHPACIKDSDCGTSGWIESPYCKSDNPNRVYQKYRIYSCLYPANIYLASCQQRVEERVLQTCPSGQVCLSGQCVSQNQLPFIKIIIPNGGEVWKVGESYTIRWTSANIPPEIPIKIVLLNEKDKSTTIIGRDYAFSLGFTWKIPTSIKPDNYRIQVFCETNQITCSDQSDQIFTIGAETISCTDSDGKNYYTKGIVRDRGKVYTDYCLNSSSLKEYFCLPGSSIGLGGVAEENVVCPSNYKCEDGVCVPIQSTNSIH